MDVEVPAREVGINDGYAVKPRSSIGWGLGYMSQKQLHQ